MRSDSTGCWTPFSEAATDASVRTAFRVLSVADEYVVMQALGVESVLSQSLVEEHYDRIEISGATGYEGDEIYFDVSRR